VVRRSERDDPARLPGAAEPVRPYTRHDATGGVADDVHRRRAGGQQGAHRRRERTRLLGEVAGSVPDGADDAYVASRRRAEVDGQPFQ
jgi:hypothetical protein